MRVGVEAGCIGNQRGFGRFVRNLLPQMLRRNPDDEFVVFTDDQITGLESGNVAVVHVACRRRVVDAAVDRDRRSLMDLQRFRKTVRSAEVDVMFFPAVYSWFPLHRGAISVVTFHDTIAHQFPKQVFPRSWNRWLWNVKSRLAARQATRVLTVSESARREVITIFKLDPSRVDLMTEAAEPSFHPVQEPGKLAATRSKLGIPWEDYFLFVGGLSPHKNLKRLLEALEELPVDTEGARLVIAGDPDASGFHSEYQALRCRVEASVLNRKRVLFTGFVAEDDLSALYSGARALVLPSLSEGFGLPAVEAMACGTPVLASRGGALPSTVGPAGLFFDANDVHSMSAAMMRILGDDKLRNRLSTIAVEQAAKFSWERAADQVMICIRSCAVRR